MGDDKEYVIEELAPLDVDPLSTYITELINRNVPDNKYLQGLQLLSDIKNDSDSEEVLLQVKRYKNKYCIRFIIPKEYNIITAVYIPVDENDDLYLLYTDNRFIRLTDGICDESCEIESLFSEANNLNYANNTQIKTINGEDYIQTVPVHPFYYLYDNATIESCIGNADIIYVQCVKCSEEMGKLAELYFNKNRPITNYRLQRWLETFE